MATQLKQPDPEPQDQQQDNDIQQVDDAPRDYEAEARSRGWVPQDEFKGDATRWVDAETFIERTETVMPLLKAENARMKRELSDMKRQMRQFSKHASAAEERIRAEIQSEMEAAVEAGDVEGFRKLQKKADELTDGKSEAPKHTQEEVIEAFDVFREENPWYDRANLANASEIDINARLYADRMTEKHIKKTEEMAPDEFFAFIADEVKKKYPQIVAKPRREKPQSDVSPAGNGRMPRNTKTWENLPAEARQRFEKWINNGLGDKDYYLKTFDWDGYAKASG